MRTEQFLYVHYTTNILAKLSTWCFDHPDDISCSSHTDESWEGLIYRIYIYIYICIYICMYVCIYIYLFMNKNLKLTIQEMNDRFGINKKPSQRRGRGFYKFFKENFVAQETIDINISWPSNFFGKYFMAPSHQF